MTVSAYILPTVTGLLPKKEVKLQEFSHLRNVVLADPTFHRTGVIDVLLGADVFYDVLRDGRITGKEGYPVGQQTVWGFVVGGKCPSQAIPTTISVHHTSCIPEQDIARFWELEEVPRKQFLTVEEKKCEDHFSSTHSRAADGRYVVRLPFRDEVTALGVSVNTAEKRLKMMEKRLSSNPELKSQYVEFMREYLALGHMELVPDDEINKPPDQVYYLSHHAVIKEDSTTTKVRVVFDASASTSTKVSLNDMLITGPKLQDDLFCLLIRFCLFLVAMKADIAKMFRQIWVDRRDCDFQRILWRESPDQPIRHYRLLTVTYGTSVAPYLAKRCLQHLADDEACFFPEASEFAKGYLYMDDLMASMAGKLKALEIQKQLIELMQKGGFDLRKWISNCSELLAAVPESKREAVLPLRIDETDTTKALGLTYHPLFDHFKFHVNLPKHRDIITKRIISSEMGKVFDPIGWLAPVTISAKILFQQLWVSKLGWDEDVGTEFEHRWRSYQRDLPEIENIRIPRCLLPNDSCKFRLLCFSDASEKAYGAVIYIQALGSDQKPKILAAKTKLAPIKQISLPRLELCAAVLLVRLLDAVTYALNCKAEEVLAWTDSMIVLHWLQGHPGRWYTFVANRVSEVQECLPAKFWHHVSGTDNPADCISRGIMASELEQHSLWWHGPRWLNSFPEEFNEQPIEVDAGADVEERTMVNAHYVNSSDFDFSLLERYSSLPKVLRVTVLIFRFGGRSRGFNRTGPITVKELRYAMRSWVRLVQRSAFPEVIHRLSHGNMVHTESKISSLNPNVDAEGLVRVGGRLQHAKIPHDQKFPILLPKKHRFVELLVRHEHLVNLHAGPTLLLATLQTRFWILGGRDVVRKYVRCCVTCCKHRAQVATQMMGDLPAVRVNPVRPFLKIGIDYAGPITLRVIKGRGHRFYKGYIAIFICFVTRALHLELVTDLSSNAFVAALKRFAGRRGKPSDVYCDNGKTFVGAQKQLNFTRTAAFNQCVESFLAEENVVFHLNPPSAPNFGGLWEAGIKSVKYHLRRVLGNQIFNYEEMTTLLIQIEACLNSRPISALSNDPDDLQPLTPGHFLIGDAMTTVPEPSLLDESTSYANKWKLVQKTYQDFWRRWSAEYLTRLQQRPKWLQPKANLKVDDLVLIKDGRFPPLKWKLGRVSQLHPGQDQLVRVVTLRTSDGIVKRPVTKICPLPVC